MKKLMFLSSHDKLGMFSGTPAPAGMHRDTLSRINADMKRAMKPE